MPRTLWNWGCLAACLVLGLQTGQSQQFQSVRDCVAGRRVTNNGGRKGTITKVDTAWSYCTVKFDDTGREESLLYSLLRLDQGSVADLKAGGGQQFQSFKDCVVGRKVTNNAGRNGTITKVDPAWSYCTVRFENTGKEESILYSLLRAPGGVGASTLSPGVYECVTSGQTPMLLRLTSATTYSVDGRTGNVRVSSDGGIRFETGPLANGFHSMLLSEGRIGLNTDGGSFYPISCELNRNLR